MTQRRNRGYRSDEELTAEAKILAKGLARLGSEFRACLCPSCEGKGERRQRYVEGTFRGDCDQCEGQGLVWHDGGYAWIDGRHMRQPPPGDSVVNQVMEAGR